MSGAIYHDIDGDGVRGTDEPGISGAQVYLDLNNSGGFDDGEPSAVSDADGGYSLTDAPVGASTLRVVAAAGNRASAWVDFPDHRGDYTCSE